MGQNSTEDKDYVITKLYEEDIDVDNLALSEYIGSRLWASDGITGDYSVVNLMDLFVSREDMQMQSSVIEALFLFTAGNGNVAFATEEVIEEIRFDFESKGHDTGEIMEVIADIKEVAHDITERFEILGRNVAKCGTFLGWVDVHNGLGAIRKLDKLIQ